MSDEKIERLKKFLEYDNEFHVYWRNFDGKLERIKSVGQINLPKDHREWEPGPVAYVDDGYIALWNADESDIQIYRKVEL